MEILEGITEEKLTGEDSINGTTHGKDEAIEDVINECFLSPAQAEPSKTISELASFGPPIGAKIKNDALDDIWSPSPASRSVHVLPAIVTGKELINEVSFSRAQSWIVLCERLSLSSRILQDIISMCPGRNLRA